jgi:predicted transcriptional regulator
MYVLYICEKQLGKKKKYNFSVTKRNKDEIMIDIISGRGRLKNPPVLTKRKIKSYAKGLFLPE